VTADRDGGHVRVTEGGRRLARTRHNLGAAGLTMAGWRAAGRETMGRGRRGRRFRRTVAGIPTAVFRARLTAQAHRHGIQLYAVNPAYERLGRPALAQTL